MWVTRKMPEDVVTDMTGYTRSTIKAWRRKLLGWH